MASSLQYRSSLFSRFDINQILRGPKRGFHHVFPFRLVHLSAFVISTTVPDPFNSDPSESSLVGADRTGDTDNYGPDIDKPLQNKNKMIGDDVASDRQMTDLVTQDDSSHKATKLVTDYNGNPNFQALIDNSIIPESDCQLKSYKNAEDRSCHLPNSAQGIPETPGLPFIGSPSDPNAHGAELLAPVLQVLGVP